MARPSLARHGSCIGRAPYVPVATVAHGEPQIATITVTRTAEVTTSAATSTHASSQAKGAPRAGLPVTAMCPWRAVDRRTGLDTAGLHVIGPGPEIRRSGAASRACGG